MTDALLPDPKPADPEPPKPAPAEAEEVDALDPTRFGDWERKGRCIDF